MVNDAAMTGVTAARRARGGVRGRAPASAAGPGAADSPFDRKPIGDVWELYLRSGDEEIRNYLALKYQHLIRRNAERVCAALPSVVDVEDLMSAGQFGLFDAIRGYDPRRQVKFETYCAQRIRGAMIDELRIMDEESRTARRRQAMMEKARRELTQRYGRPPTRDEIRERLGVGEEEFLRIERDSRVVVIGSFTRKPPDGGGPGDTREIDVARDEDADSPLGRVLRKDLQDLITRGLSRAERLIVVLYYYEGMTMKEIGATLDLSESRVSQMHSSILQRLKAQMQHRARELEPAR